MFATIGTTRFAYAQFSDFFDQLSKGKEEFFENAGSKDNDGLYIDRALLNLIAKGVTGAKAEWRNPKNKRHGKIGLTARATDFMGRPCWKFFHTRVLKNQETKHFGLVCNMSEDTDDPIVADWVITELTPASRQ
jgi:hypothetical protein